ncbi:MAG TPA: hypothetical protein VIX18_01055 [Nitrospirota bacterium]
MKIIRLTDDRYVIDVGPSCTAEAAHELANQWANWWATATTMPTALLVNGISTPLEYEDHRDSNIEKRVQNLEAFFGEALKRMIDEETSSS